MSEDPFDFKPPPKEMEFQVITALPEGYLAKRQELADSAHGLRKHNYYSAVNGLDFLSLVRKWKELSFANISVPHETFGLLPKSMKLRLLCAKQYLLDHPEVCQDCYDAVQNADIGVKDSKVMLRHKIKISGTSLADAIKVEADTPKSDSLIDQLLFWLNSDVPARDQFFRLQLNLSEDEVAQLKAVLDKYKASHTGTVKGDRIVVIKLASTLDV